MAEILLKTVGQGLLESKPLNTERCDSISLEWKNITYTVKTKHGSRKISNNLSGKALPGTLMAVMGPSGAGKTTLLNILTGYYEDGFEGEVHVNGYLRDVTLFNKQSCYVMQEECLLPELTVKEALTVAVTLRLSNATPLKQKEFIVTDAMQKWGIEHAENTRTSNLSGGERRRLSIAQELIGNPPVFFLDEPTRGLDSMTSLKCIEIMKSLAESGHTVICSVHQPSAMLFAYFDKLYMISNGQCIYNGPVTDLVSFLSSNGLNCPEYHNPADFVTEIAAGEYGDCTEKLAQNFLVDYSPIQNADGLSPLGGKILSDEEKEDIREKYGFATGRFHQFWIVWKRSFTCTLRNRILTPVRISTFLVATVCLSLICGDIGYWADDVYRNAFLFVFFDLFLVFASMIPTLIIFPIEISVVLREHRNCWYTLKTYCAAKMLADLPVQACSMAIMLSAIYFSTKQPLIIWRFTIFLVIGIQSLCACQALGFAVSAISTVENSLVMCLFATAPFFLFNGFFATLKSSPFGLHFLLYVSFFFYSYTGKMQAVFGFEREDLPCKAMFCLIVNPEKFLDFMQTAYIPLYVCSAVIFVSDLVFRIAAYLILKWRLKSKR